MPGKNFVIGDASAKDSSAITGMYYRLYPNRARRGVRRRVTEVKSRNRIFVARSGKAPVGFLVATFTSYGGSRYGYIEELFVDEAHRRSGIGRGLVEKAVNWFRFLKAEVVFLTTGERGPVMFYKALGFRRSSSYWMLWTPKRQKG